MYPLNSSHAPNGKDRLLEERRRTFEHGPRDIVGYSDRQLQVIQKQAWSWDSEIPRFFAFVSEVR